VRYPQRLRSVVTRQEIRASRFQLWQEVVLELQFDFRLRFSKYAQNRERLNGGAYFRLFASGALASFFCLVKRR